MYARVQMTPTLPDHVNTPEASGYFIKVLEGHPGFRGVHLILQIGSRRGLSVTLWDSRVNAEAASDRTQEVMGPRPFTLDFDGIYEVLAGHAGPAAVAEASVAQVLWFDGPLSAAQVDAMRRAGEERIRRDLAGKPWQGLTAEFLEKRWASFCYLSPTAYRYYLPSLLVGALDGLDGRQPFAHSCGSVPGRAMLPEQIRMSFRLGDVYATYLRLASRGRESRRRDRPRCELH